MKTKFRILAAGTALATALVLLNGSAYAATAAEPALITEQTSAAMIVQAIGKISQPWGLAEAEGGGLIVVSAGSNQISKWQDNKLTAVTTQTASGYLDGTTVNAAFNHPSYSAVNSKGLIYVSDTDNHVVRRVAKERVYTAAGDGKPGYKDGKFGDAQFNAPAGLAIDTKDNVYVADTLNNVIRMISPEGVTTTFAGAAGEAGGYKDGGAAEAKFNEPMGLAFDEKGGLYVADSGNHLIRYIRDGKVTTVAGKPTTVDATTGYMAGGYVNGTSADARFDRPRGLAYADGVLYVADSLNNRIRAVRAGKVISIAGQSAPGNVVGSADAAQFNQPSSLLYSAGKLYIADTLNDSVKRLEVDAKTLKPILTKQELVEGTELLPAGKDVQVWLEGKRVEFANAQKPFKKGDKTYLPVRAVFASWGAEVKWNAAAQEVQLAKQSWKLTLKVNAKRTVILEKGALYVEADYLADAATFLLAHDSEFNAIIMASGQ
ncbi:sugar lactone lactonase YvrE [Paenibacillus endophyticus]|uniref:Sugar lactone lactonase YvrE n=1 Tax=Paenibacillus endophyticus TaxID=1294268 RepID=A0A7W5C8R6_9BACL|nr:stalk domain-containing protein [Paenibacillus endophyticus]MBB3153211.1 sugar lactone lactonase YvrE [Paenibacillus endophyticus]